MKFSPFDRSPEPDLSPDLEWMLQSGWASDEILIEALVREHYAEVCILAAELLGDDIQQAHALAKRVVADAILTMHAYPADLGVRGWLISLLEKRARTWRQGDGPSSDLSRAGNVAVPVLGDVILNAPGYPAGIGLHYWLRTPAPERSGEGQESQIGGRNSVLFNALSEPEIKRVISRVQELVARGRSKHRFSGIREILVASLVFLCVLFAGRWVSSLAPEPAPMPGLSRTALVTRLVYVSPAPLPSSTPTPFPERAILYTAGKGDTLASLAEKLGMELALLQALNGLEPDAQLESGQAIMLGIGGIPLSLITPTPVTPVSLPEPLTTASRPHEVFQRILESERYWHTLWVDAEAIEYWPPGFVGPHKVKRLQAWISRPHFSVVLLGDPSGRLESVSLTNFGKNYTIDALTGKRELYTSFGLVLWQLDGLIQQLFTSFETGSSQEIAGIEGVAGREALVLDWYREEGSPGGQPVMVRGGTYWVDTRTGIILKLQRFDQDPEEGEFLVSETVINKIVYDVDLNNALFDPNLPLPSRFALNYKGDPYPEDLVLPTPNWAHLPGHEPQPRLPPPPDFDPSRSRLTFQWTFGSAFDNDLPTLTDIFAGRYYLGSIDMGDPNRLICARSPDGRKIAYSEWLEGPWFGTAPPRWLDLTEVNRVHQPASEVQPLVFAFSPESERLAFLGSEGVNDIGLYLLDLASDDWQRILDLWSGDNLLWSPDGRYLALTGTEVRNANWKLLIVNAESGEITYSGPIEIGREGQWFPLEDSPLPGWGLSYVPPRPEAVVTCARPPE